MTKYIRIVLILCLSSIVLMACSGDNAPDEKDTDHQENTEATTHETEHDQDENNQSNTNREDSTDVAVTENGEIVEQNNEGPPWEQELPEVPGTYKKAVDYPITGEFAGASYEDQADEIETELDNLPELSDSFDNEADQYKRYLYSLFAEGYNMPNIPVQQWESMTVGNPDETEDEEQIELKENYHVAILLDSSGSMANYENDKTRMELAKESINRFVSDLPDQAQVTLQVYGHKGSGSEEDKAMSCDSVETLYDLDEYQKESFQSALETFEPTGWTPLAKAIEDVTDEFEAFDGEKSTNIIYVVSDGEETCGGDPVQAVADLADSNIKPVVNLIGYQANQEGIEQLKEMAQAAEGNFINATNQDQLNEEFDRTRDLSQIWRDWHKDKQGDIKELHNTLSNQIDEWHTNMKERYKRQKDNLETALDYLEEEREFDFGPDPGLEFRQNHLGISNEVRSMFLELDNANRLSFLSLSNDVRMKYLEEND